MPCFYNDSMSKFLIRGFCNKTGTTFTSGLSLDFNSVQYDKTIEYLSNFLGSDQNTHGITITTWIHNKKKIIDNGDYCFNTLMDFKNFVEKLDLKKSESICIQ